MWQPFFFGTRNGNRTHNYPLGGGYYIHLTMQAEWRKGDFGAKSPLTSVIITQFFKNFKFFSKTIDKNIFGVVQ